MPSAYKMMKANYHTHMYLCRHAEGTVEDYVKKAIEVGLKTIGMSDHAPFEDLKDRSIRMLPNELPIYIDECDEAIRKYSDRIKILKGLEIEYFDHHEQYYKELNQQFDFLALGQHYITLGESAKNLKSTFELTLPTELKRYADTLVKAIASGIFKFVCHPDLMLFGYGNFDNSVKAASEKIIDAAVKYNIPLEINANGIRRGTYHYSEGNRYIYPRLEFWQLAKERKAKVIISSDAHHPKHLYDEAIEAAYKFAANLGIEVVDEMEF
ncbi:MAG: histidinol-phosphatase [Candidatus Izemoplasmatales bacterium]|jgi:histidinol-phosphatase (PHP family)